MQTEFSNLDDLIAEANPKGAPRKAAGPAVRQTPGSRHQRKHIAEQFEFPIDQLIAEANQSFIIPIVFVGSTEQPVAVASA
jgi:hypothetical protein